MVGLRAAVGVGALLIGGACAAPPPASPPRPEEPPVRTDLHPAGDESLCEFAGRHGVAPAAIAEANGLAPDAALAEGTMLVVADGAEASVHTVSRGDTLSWIAGWSGLPVEDLARASGIEDPDRLEVGDAVRLPPGAATACAPAHPPPPVARARSVVREAERQLELAFESYASANYALSVAEARRARELLGARAGPEARRLRARASLFEGLAATGMGTPVAARAAFGRAVAEDPTLELDPALASPRVVELFEEARAARAAPAGAR